jgi:hypothetical protein
MAQEMVELEGWKVWLCEDVARSEVRRQLMEAQAVALVKEVAYQVPDRSTRRQDLQSPRSKALDAEHLDLVPTPVQRAVEGVSAPTPLVRLPHPSHRSRSRAQVLNSAELAQHSSAHH